MLMSHVVRLAKDMLDFQALLVKSGVLATGVHLNFRCMTTSLAFGQYRDATCCQ